MKVAIGQINSFLGSFKENRKNILRQTKQAKSLGVELLVFPEATLMGYHPVDLLELDDVVSEQLSELDKLSKELPEGIAIFVGAITRNTKKLGKPYFNSAVFIEKNKKMRVFPKELLPTYDVFDEGRHIEQGDLSKNLLRYKGKKIFVTICEDIWAWPNEKSTWSTSYNANPIKKLKPRDADMVVNLSASPFTVTKLEARREVVKKTASYFKVPMIYANMVGAQDELIFDGASFAVNGKGQVVAQAKRFTEDLLVIEDLFVARPIEAKEASVNEIRKEATLLGIRDFVKKTGFDSVHLGLSGGIDSAVVATLAAEALGGDKVHCIALPSPFNSPNSLKWAKQLATNIGAHWHEMSISKIYESSIETLEQDFGKLEFGLVHENAQARIRCLLLMAFSNFSGSLLLNPSNKSELAMGYSTLYGDLSGGLSVIGDFLKTEVYEMARYLNKERKRIPQEIIDRDPSAELRPNQKDSDSLPPYEELDRIINKLVIECKKPTSQIEKRVFNSMIRSEFKRWQAPPILKVSNHAFGRGRRFPVAHAVLK